MRRGIVYALLAAALFGASTPFAKALSGSVHPVVLAGLLYAGSGVGLAIVQLLRMSIAADAQLENQASGSDAYSLRPHHSRRGCSMKRHPSTL